MFRIIKDIPAPLVLVSDLPRKVAIATFLGTAIRFFEISDCHVTIINADSTWDPIHRSPADYKEIRV